MAGKKPTKEEIFKTISIYITDHPGVQSTYDEETDIYLLKDVNGIERMVGPGWNVEDDALQEDLYKILQPIIDARNAPQGSNLPAKRESGNISASSQRSSQGGAMAMVREAQATEKPTYSTGKGRTVASAKTNIAALMEAGGSLIIIERNHRPDYIEYTVRASLPTGKIGAQTVDSSMSVWKQEYLAKKAWEWIMKPLMDDATLVSGVDEFGMPEFKEGKTIKVRMSVEEASLLVALPAKIALWREMAREWQSAGRVCESKAYSRAADMLLRGDFQNREEKAEEISEIKAIRDKEA